MRLNRKPKKSDPSSKLVLEEIIGLTTKNANGLASNVATGDCLYTAGCVVVVYNVDSGTQMHLMVSSRMPKPLSCVAVLQGDGRFAAAGESGHQPAVIVWDYTTRAIIQELKVHRYGVSCIAFSPDGKHLVSVGFPHDGYLCLWDWRSGTMVTKVKSSSSCTGISCVKFSSDAQFFVTAGKKHLKFWAVGSCTKPRSNAGESLPTMDGKSVNLGCLKGSSFISVASANWMAPSLVGKARTAKFYPIYALTNAGILCLINSGFLIKSSVDLQVEKSFALSVSNKLIACACSNGIVQLFTIETLKHVGNLQYLETKQQNEAKDSAGVGISSDKGFQATPDLPNAIACQFSTSEKLVVVYEDHSLYVWDVHDVFKVRRCCVLVSHSACVWDVKNLPCDNMHDPALACVARGCCGGVSFATCSADGTIRLWDLLLQTELENNSEGPEVALNQHVGSTSWKDEQVSGIHLVSAGIFERDIVETGIETQGFRSMAVSSDGKYMAAGDCQGNLHVYNLHTSDYTCIQEAHDSEILSLAFSFPSKICNTAEKVSENFFLLASGGRDRIIHLYDVKRGLELIQSLDDHSAAVTSVKLTHNGYKIVSCSADRSLVYRDVSITDTGCKVSRSHHQIASHGTVYDMALDPSLDIAVTVGQDKKINTFSLSTGKLVKTFKQDGDFGEPIKVSLDPSSSYLVCSYSNKSICIYDFTNGELVTQAVGHGEVITGVVFLPDCKHIVSVGGDGCIFLWRLPILLSSRILQRMKERAGQLSPISIQKPLFSSESILQEVGIQGNPSPNRESNKDDEGVGLQDIRPQDFSAFKFSISRLPKWAQAKVTSKDTICAHTESVLSQKVELELVPSWTANDAGMPTPKGPIEAKNSHSHGLGGSELCLTNISESSCGTNASDSSPVLHHTHSFVMDKRWLTVHTVYHDLLDSPEAREFKDAMIPFPAPNFLKDPAIKGLSKEEAGEITQGDSVAMGHPCLKPFCGPSNQALLERDGLLLSGQLAQIKSSNSGNLCENDAQPSACSSGTSCEASTEPLGQELREFHMQKVKEDGDIDDMNQDEDLYGQHFSSLSSAMKLEGKRSSAKRSYSARFVVRRDHLIGSEKLFRTPYRALGDEVVPHTSFEHLPKQVSEECQGSDICSQEIKKQLDCLPSPAFVSRQSDSTNSCTTNHPANVGSKGDEDQRHINLEGSEILERINGCKEALLNLDSAAQSTLQLFSKMVSLISGEEASSEQGAELYEQAAKLLPTVTVKIRALSELVESSKRYSCPHGRAESPGFEPFIGRFSENLSRQVLELVKQNI